ncbi:unnamed protein product [Lymnaea stagnalis]|uniref:Uncharacterized protein n=1 Tax=Lymnaea stagnalis TaxID=6523 RepID=A0AAV2HPI7_LYMST
MAFLLNGSEDQEESVRMPLALFFKQLTMKMASLQSPRTQCCCCAVGVFAAMFGIFMLSAGICIVLNVTFMEVDTSGLPPELHNEEGKKVVGIILICVSIATLGLSASVSVVYFVVCNKKPRSSAPPNPSAQPAQPGATSARQVIPPGNRTPGSVTPAGGHHRRSSGHHTPSTLRREVSTVDGLPVGRSVSPQPSGRNTNPSISGSRHSRSRRQSPKSHKPHRRAFKPGLASHMEEDLEATRSVNDFQMHQQSTGSSSNSGTSTSPSGQSVRASEDRSHRKSSMPPVIVIDEPSSPVSTIASENELAETQFGDYGNLIDTFKSGPSVDPGHGPCTPGSVTFVTEINNYVSDSIYPRDTFRTTSQDDSDMATPPSLPYNIDVVDDDTSRDFSPTQTPPMPSHPRHKHNILLVRSQDGADQITPWSSTNTLDVADLVQEENDHISDLPSQHLQSAAAGVGPREQFNRSFNSADDHNSRSESRASYNSAFSFNGEELDYTLEEVKRRMEEMQKE